MRPVHSELLNFLLLGILLTFGCATSHAHADDVSLVGKSVYPRDPSILVKRGNESIAKGAELSFPIMVRRQTDDEVTIWVSKSKQEGQVRRQDLLSALEAVPVYSQRIGNNPNDLYAVFVLSLVWEDLGNVDQALAVMSQALKDHPHAILFNRRGNLWQKKRAFHQAIQDYNESLRLDPASVSCLFNRGLAHSYLGRDDLAISDYEAVLRLSPLYTSAYVARASSWNNRGDRNRAVSDLTMAIILNHDDGLAYQERANLWYRQGEYTKALADYEDALRLQPQERHATIHLNRGMIWVKLGLYGLALSDFDQAVRLDHQNAAAYNNRGWIRATCPESSYRNGRLALADAKRACELAQWNNPHHLSTLGEASAAVGDFESAIHWQELASQLQTLRKLGDIDFQAGSKRRLACYKSGKPFRESRP